jgi:Domain of unknown function (DUF4278)
MKLSYRGNSYESNNLIIQVSPTGITGKFRRISYQIHEQQTKIASPAVSKLKYRGCNYGASAIRQK